MLLDSDNEQEWQESERLNEKLVALAIAADGTCTGEHGIGLHKLDFMRQEHGDDVLALMWAIKRAYDPNNILNPGKVLPVLGNSPSIG
jgi:D-lactate dehydrogenase (cytochrome)